MDPADVGRAARGWDEQHLDLAAAATQIAEAPVDGFTEVVAPVAAFFLQRWHRCTDDVATRAEGRADGLRETVRTWLEADRAGAFGLQLYGGILEEQR